MATVEADAALNIFSTWATEDHERWQNDVVNMWQAPEVQCTAQEVAFVKEKFGEVLKEKDIGDDKPCVQADLFKAFQKNLRALNRELRLESINDSLRSIRPDEAEQWQVVATGPNMRLFRNMGQPTPEQQARLAKQLMCMKFNYMDWQPEGEKLLQAYSMSRDGSAARVRPALNHSMLYFGQ